jgi:c-di-GMP-related signal transduction protein
MKSIRCAMHFRLSAGQNKSSELVLSALVRARFCELLSPKIQHGESDLFLLGLLSMMDSILEIPMTEVLDNVPIDQETKAALLGGRSRLRPLYQLMLAQESGIGNARRGWQSPSSSVKATLPKFIGRQCNGPGRSAAGDLSVPWRKPAAGCPAPAFVVLTVTIVQK